MDTKRSFKKQSGFTLFEIMIGAIVIALAVSVIVPLLTETMNKNVKVTQELSLMQTTVRNIEGRFSDEVIDGGLDNQEIIDSGMLPKAYNHVKDTGEIYNMWRGRITITGVDANGMVWESKNIPSGGVCSQLIDDAKSLGFDSVTTDEGSGDYIDLTNADITQLCNADTETVTVTWTRNES